MCTGRVEPYWVIEAFLRGADGVMVAGCRIGECHYANGNLVAQYRMKAVERILVNVGLNPERFSLQWMSSAEGNRFSQAITEFTGILTRLGHLGEAEQKDKELLDRKLLAAKKALQGKKLRWVLGKAWEFTRQGNLYGERFTLHELGRCLEEIILDECGIQEILLLLEAGPLSVKELASRLEQPPPVVLRRLADMKRMGLVQADAVEGDRVVWSLADNLSARQERVA